jgi:trans-aconitate methyltransferase
MITSSDEKSSNYYGQERRELISLLDPITNAAILDIGCGEGALGSALKSLGCGPVYGIECMAAPAQVASQRYDRVFNCKVEEVDFTQLSGIFDFVICADILEHLTDPWSVIRSLKSVLKPSGAIVASIPNLRNREIISNLICGSFEYREEGILDIGHLRFFTFSSVVRLFQEAGYRIDVFNSRHSTGAQDIIASWKKEGVPQMLQQLVKLLTNTSLVLQEYDLLDFFSLQFILRARVV